MVASPTAVYVAPDGTEKHFDVGNGPHSTSGTSTKISDVVIKAGGEDRDKPSEAKDTPLGHLRAELTTLQDQVNVFLTQRMKGGDEDMERRVLDGGDEEEEEE
jgi:protein GON7